MPDRSGGIDDIATAVAGDTESPAPLPRKNSPSRTIQSGFPTP